MIAFSKLINAYNDDFENGRQADDPSNEQANEPSDEQANEQANEPSDEQANEQYDWRPAVSAYLDRTKSLNQAINSTIEMYGGIDNVPLYEMWWSPFVMMEYEETYMRRQAWLVEHADETHHVPLIHHTSYWIEMGESWIDASVRMCRELDNIPPNERWWDAEHYEENEQDLHTEQEQMQDEIAEFDVVPNVLHDHIFQYVKSEYNSQDGA
jgi:hypothetical protein